jgi:transcriptional regulator with XRE-family HTH domain
MKKEKAIRFQRLITRRNTTLVTLGSNIGHLSFKIESRLPPRARRTVALAFFRQIRPFFAWVRTASIDHFDSYEFDSVRAVERGVTVFPGRGVDTTLGRLGFRIRMRRLQLGLTQVELAERASIARGNLSLLERGLRHPRVPTLLAILEALKLKEGEHANISPRSAGSHLRPEHVKKTKELTGDHLGYHELERVGLPLLRDEEWRDEEWN